MDASTKPCVACAETIKFEARLCRFCGTRQSDFPPIPNVGTDEPKDPNLQEGEPHDIYSLLVLTTAKSSWVLAGGLVSWAIFGFRPDGIYGPWQPVGVFAGGSVVFAVLLLIGSSIAISEGRPKTQVLRSWRLGFASWSVLSLLLFLASYAISMAHYASNESASNTTPAVASTDAASSVGAERESAPEDREILPLPKTETVSPPKTQYELDIEKSAAQQLRTCQALFAHDFSSMSDTWGKPGHGAIVLDHHSRLSASLQNEIPLGDFNVYRDRMLDAMLVYGQIASMYEEIQVYDSWEVWTPQNTFWQQYDYLVSRC